MPIINGRYYMNPFYGRALEKARMAEEGRVWSEEPPELEVRPVRNEDFSENFWDDDPPSGGTQQQDSNAHWVTIDHRHVLVQEAQARQTLTSAQDKVMRAYKPQGTPGKPGRKTFCNEATCSVAIAMGAPMGPLTDAHGVPLKADQIGANLAKPGSGYKQVSADQAQRLANQGKLVIVTGPGHVATVRPDNGQFVAGHGPVVANVGGTNGVMRLSRAFTQRAMQEVKFYTPNQ